MPALPASKTLILLAAAALGLAACAKKTVPPGDPGICYHVVFHKDAKGEYQPRYNKLVAADSLERCAANLEAMRVKFLTMGGNQQEITGAYQSNYLFLVKEGVMTSTSLEGPRYVALVRTGDGRLAVPGAMPAQ